MRSKSAESCTIADLNKANPRSYFENIPVFSLHIREKTPETGSRLTASTTTHPTANPPPICLPDKNGGNPGVSGRIFEFSVAERRLYKPELAEFGKQSPETDFRHHSVAVVIIRIRNGAGVKSRTCPLSGRLLPKISPLHHFRD
tara:strand:- start:8054 stop:8485 length:432 start_codon:yes stop_codon:yes gene_type:complete